MASNVFIYIEVKYRLAKYVNYEDATCNKTVNDPLNGSEDLFCFDFKIGNGRTPRVKTTRDCYKPCVSLPSVDQYQLLISLANLK